MMKRYFLKLKVLLIGSAFFATTFHMGSIASEAAMPHKAINSSQSREIAQKAEEPYHLSEAFNKKTAKKNISVTYKRLSDGILATYKNKNKYPVSLTGTMRFLDSEKKDIKALEDYNYCLGAKSTGTLFFPAPNDSNGNYVNYSSYKGSFSVKKTAYKSYSKKIKVSSDIQAVCTNFSVLNQSNKNLENIHIAILFYDSAGDILGYKGKYLSCHKAGSTDFFTVDHPANWGVPAKVKIYVDCAY